MGNIKLRVNLDSDSVIELTQNECTLIVGEKSTGKTLVLSKILYGVLSEEYSPRAILYSRYSQDELTALLVHSSRNGRDRQVSENYMYAEKLQNNLQVTKVNSIDIVKAADILRDLYKKLSAFSVVFIDIDTYTYDTLERIEELQDAVRLFLNKTSSALVLTIRSEESTKLFISDLISSGHEVINSVDYL